MRMILQKTKNERVSDSPSDLYAIILAQVVCFINALGGYLIARKAFMKPFEKFVSIVLGSMSLRIMLVGAFSWWALSMMNMPQLAYSLSLAIGVFVYLFVEIMYFHVLSDKIKTREKEQNT
jgi:predicted permease